MRVIPTLFALALATPTLSRPLPRSLFARNDVTQSQETSAAPTASTTNVPAVNNAVAGTPTGLAADPAESERIINDLLHFAHGDSSILLEQIRPLANDLGTMVDGMIKGAKVSWMQGFNSPPPGQNNAANNGQQPTPTPTTVTVTATPTEASSATTTSSDTTTATDTAATADSAAATPTSSGGEDEDGNSSTSPPGVGGGEEPERRSLHSKRDAPTCAKIYQSDPGDTCEVIARKFGVSTNAVLSANPFLDCNDIWTATSVCIPAFSCSQMITTQDGDTCQSIGARYQVSAMDIQNANVFLNCNSIAASTQVCVPPAPGHGPANYGGYGSGGYGGGYGGNQNMNMGYGNYPGNPQLGMQFAMMGLGMMNPGSPQNMPPIPVNSDNIAKLKAYIERMQLLATALDRFVSNPNGTNASPTPAPTVVAAVATTAPTPTTTDTATTTTDTATTTTDTATPTSTDSAASATPTDGAAAGADEKEQARSFHRAVLKQAVVGKTHPWR